MMLRIITGDNHSVHFTDHIRIILYLMQDTGRTRYTMGYLSLLCPYMRYTCPVDSKVILVMIQIIRYTWISYPVDLITIIGSIDNGRPGIGVCVPRAHPND